MDPTGTSPSKDASFEGSAEGSHGYARLQRAARGNGVLVHTCFGSALTGVMNTLDGKGPRRAKRGGKTVTLLRWPKAVGYGGGSRLSTDPKFKWKACFGGCGTVFVLRSFVYTNGW